MSRKGVPSALQPGSVSQTEPLAAATCPDATKLPYLSSVSSTSAILVPIFAVLGTHLSSSSQGPGDIHVGEMGGGQELNRAEQPAIHMDQVDKLSINGLPLESETWAQAREELLREIRIAAAIQVSL